MLANLIKASAPHRVDVGGTWDLKSFGMLYRNARPSTLNIAISLRTHVAAKHHRPGYIKIVEPTGMVEYKTADIAFDNKHGLVLAICAFMGVSGVELAFEYEAPNRSGLGGSGVVAVVTIVALQELCSHVAYAPDDIALIVQHIEDGLRFSFCGLQDQCAALYGGINLWEWKYNLPEIAFAREPILVGACDGVSDRLAVAYIGYPHNSSDVNNEQMRSLLSGSKSTEWLRINDITQHVASALKDKVWTDVIGLINEETAIRDKLAPSRMTPISRELQRSAQSVSASFAASGAGNGGCVWSICPSNAAKIDVQRKWDDVLLDVEGAKVLDVEVASEGVVVESVGDGECMPGLWVKALREKQL